MQGRCTIFVTAVYLYTWVTKKVQHNSIVVVYYSIMKGHMANFIPEVDILEESPISKELLHCKVIPFDDSRSKSFLASRTLVIVATESVSVKLRLKMTSHCPSPVQPVSLLLAAQPM